MKSLIIDFTEISKVNFRRVKCYYIFKVDGVYINRLISRKGWPRVSADQPSHFHQR
jgi:hypothetical protein